MRITVKNIRPSEDTHDEPLVTNGGNHGGKEFKIKLENYELAINSRSHFIAVQKI
jgi:hypothetical protein